MYELLAYLIHRIRQVSTSSASINTIDHNMSSPPSSGTESVSSVVSLLDLLPKDIALLERDAELNIEDDNIAPASGSMRPAAFQNHVEVLLTAERVSVSDIVAPFKHVSDRNDALKNGNRRLFARMAKWKKDTDAKFAQQEAINKELRASCVEIRASCVELRTSCVELRRNQAEVREDIKTLFTMTHALRQEISQLTAETADQNDTIVELIRQSSTLRGQISDLRIEVADLRTEVANLRRSAPALD